MAGGYCFEASDGMKAAQVGAGQEAQRRSDDGLAPGLAPKHSRMYSIRPAWPGTSPISAAFFAQASNDRRVASDTVRFFAAAAGNATATASMPLIANVAIRMVPSQF
jgi:hypothetical protein